MDGSWEYINRLQTHMNVEIGTEAPAIPFLGIHKWDLRCSVGYDTLVSGPVVYAPWLVATIRLTFTAGQCEVVQGQPGVLSRKPAT